MCRLTADRVELFTAAAQGFAHSRVGVTLVAVASAKPDPKQGTTVLRLGDELLLEGGAHLLLGGKGPLPCFRASSGRPAVVLEGNITPLVLPPPKQSIVFRGRTLADDEILFELGVRDDDTLMLEFASPAMPPVLKLLRESAPPKAAKGKGKGKGDKSPKGAKKKK